MTLHPAAHLSDRLTLRRLRVAFVVATLAVAVVACTGDDDQDGSPAGLGDGDAVAEPLSDTPPEPPARTPRALVTASIPIDPPDENPDPDDTGADDPDDSGRTPVADLQVGDCVELPRRDDGTEVDAVALQDCAEEHDAQVFARVSLDDDPESPHPGDDAVTTTAEGVCFDSFEPYVGTPYIATGLEIAFYRPNEAAWVRGDRSVVCLLFSPDGARLPGSVAAG